MIAKLAKAVQDDETHRGETIAEFGDTEVYRRVNRDHVQEAKEVTAVGVIGAVVTFALLKLYELTTDDQ